jgi:trimethylamine--corrinoid protein Co-methyltransferase
MPNTVKSISSPKISLSILDDGQIQQIHEATLDVIESVGVCFPSSKALDVLENHGASVDRNSMIARIPGAVVEEHIKNAPAQFTLAGADPGLDLPLDGNHSYLGTDGCGVEILDIVTGEKRRTHKRDLIDVSRVADFMEGIAFHWVAISAQDCPPNSRSLHELEAVWSVSKKHVQTESIVNEREMQAAVKMAEIMSRGSDLRKNSALSIMQCTLSPLGHDGGSLDAAMVSAEAGIPVGFMTMASAGSTGPVTLAGNLVVGNAEVISALALMQMIAPGCPVFYAAAQTAVDLRTGAYTGGGPEDFLFGAATNLLADYYNVPLSMGAFATGAKEPDWQAALDNSLSAFMAVSTLSDMLLGAGLLHGSRIFSYEMLVMDCEIWSLLENMFTGIEVNETTLALDAIQQVGPGGSYLGQKHTRQYMRKRWIPTLMDRRTYDEWSSNRDGSRDWARENATRILDQHYPDPLDRYQKSALSEIIQKIELGEF